MSIRVLLVDDQPLFVYSLAQVIKYRAKDIEILGIVDDGQKAIDFVTETTPDVIIMDIMMPKVNGVQATKIILEKHPSIKIMMLTTFDEDSYVLEALSCGAKGYLLKNLKPEDVITAIRAIFKGVNQVSPSIISNITRKLQGASRIDQRCKETPAWYKSLTEVEKQVTYYACIGMSNKEIGYKLNLAEQTVKNYLNRIFSKADVHKRSQLVKLCLEADIKST